MKRFIAVIIISLLSFSVFAQNTLLDSLQYAVDASSGIEKVDLLTDLCLEYYYENDIELCEKYGNEAIQLAESLNDYGRSALASKYMGFVNFYDDPIAAINHFERGYLAYEKANDLSGMANMRQVQAEANTVQGDANRGLELGLEALALVEQTNDDLRKASILIAIGNAYNDKEEGIDQAIAYYTQALPIFETEERIYEIGNVLQNLGDAYRTKGEYQKALEYYYESLEAYDDEREVPSKLLSIGETYIQLGMFKEALINLELAKSGAEKNGVDVEIAMAIMAQAQVMFRQTNYLEAEKLYGEALNLLTSSEEIDSEYKNELKEAYEGLSATLSMNGDYQNAFKFQTQLMAIKDSLHESDNKKTMDLTNANFVNEQQKAELAVNEATLQTQRLQRNAFFGGFVFIFAIAFIIYRNYRNKAKTNKILDKQNAQIDTLLLNILPEQVARELQHDGYATPRNYASATVLFTDFKGFTTISAGLEPRELIAELNSYFNEFDNIIEQHGLEKIKTIGDAYMCAGGIPSRNETHPLDAVAAGLEMQAYIRRKNDERETKGLVPWELRVGIHTGPVVAGVVGRKKYAYDIWGDTVNIASRMESNGEAYEVNISEATYELVKDKYTCVDRGKIEVKGAGEKHMYFVKPNTDKDLTATEATEVEALK